MPQTKEFWTDKRIMWLEQALAQLQGNAYATRFLDWLSRSQTIEQKRAVIAKEIIAAVQQEATTSNGDGQEIPMRLALREILQSLLYREHVIERIPTNEPDTPEEQTERERLAQIFGGGESVAEMVAEDRGPR